MSVRDFPHRPQGAPPESVPHQNWLDTLGQRQNIDLMQELTSVASGDEIAIFDVSETGQVKTKKATVSNIVAGAGAVIGPASATDHAAVRFDLITGKLVQNSAFIIDDSGHVSSFGGQIAFPATQAASSGANTLDDYEEGTWTPGIAFGGGTTGITYSQQVGSYTKIGERCLINGRAVLSAKGSSTGNSAVTGLPFTTQNVTNQIGTFAFTGSAFSASANYVNTSFVPNVTTVNVSNFAAGANAIMSDAFYTNTTSVNFCGNYPTA